MRPSPVFSLRIRSFVSRHDVVPPEATVQKPIEAAYYRGGTSRAVIIQPQALPKHRAKWPNIFRQIMGSGDPYGRQLDGMGAGISSLSKICLVEPYGKRIALPERGTRFRTGFGGIDAARESARAAQALEEAKPQQQLDIDYTFVGLGIENDEVDVAGNCGNMGSAIGPYAYNAGLLPARIYAQGDGEVTVKIRNTNTGKLIDSTFEVIGAEAAVAGDYKIDGVTGPGSKIKLDFKHPYGSKTGKVLPTGRRVDNVGGYRVSCVDGANPCIFIRADDVGVDGTILPNDFNKLPDKLALLENIRKTAAVAMGIAPTEDDVPRTIPKIGLVSQSSSHPVLSGQTLKSSQMDIVIRFLSDTQPHRAIPLTAALTSAVAARIQGTIVEQMLAPEPLMDGAITIGHASGRLQVNATMDMKNKLYPVSGTVFRTAKRLFEGETFWSDKTDKREEAIGADSPYGSNGIHSLGLAFVLENRGESSAHLFEEDSQLVQQQEPNGPDVDQNAPQQQTLEQIEQNEQSPPEVKTPMLSNRPLPDQHRKRPDLRKSTTKEGALTSALQGLHSELSTLLSDTNVTATAQHSTSLLTAVLKAHRSIQINAIAQKRSAKKVADKAKKMERRMQKNSAKLDVDGRRAHLGNVKEQHKAPMLSRWPQINLVTPRRLWKNASDRAREKDESRMENEVKEQGEEYRRKFEGVTKAGRAARRSTRDKKREGPK
ncbi:mannan endo-1,6-alpha-mannosidase [Alternaria panax]|uniref:Mannan endo-1,6-alpha-mannosidase n=1 Tax=Alternaria panax TaxID=48097 RepID=A0AAD4I4X1_9PLEO|nr:mannan endo-1,6-alpha-mannosidase [Alternaria panax]